MTELNIAHHDYEHAMQHISDRVGDLTHVSCHIEFGADHSQSKIIRDFIGKIFIAHHIDAPWKGRFILITDELINNAIEHGSAENDLDSCIIEANTTQDGLFHISIEVHDTGRGKDSGNVKNILQIKQKKEKNVETYMGKRGRGLFYITEKLVDRLSFDESPKGGLAVKVEKSIPATLA